MSHLRQAWEFHLHLVWVFRLPQALVFHLHLVWEYLHHLAWEYLLHLVPSLLDPLEVCPLHQVECLFHKPLVLACLLLLLVSHQVPQEVLLLFQVVCLHLPVACHPLQEL